MLKRTENFEHYSLLSRQVKAVLGEHGWLQKQDSFHYSPKQEAYALHVVECLTQQGLEDSLDGHAAIQFLEADTGVGKSLGYLIPVALYVALTGRRAAISTFTRVLQRQLIEGDWPIAQKIVEELTGKSLQVALRMGRRNFLCVGAIERRLNELKKSRAKNKTEIEACLHAMLNWLSSPSSSGLVFDFLEHYGVDELPYALRQQDLQPKDRKSPGFARYADHVALSQEADIVITNHAVTVLNSLTRQRLLQVEGQPITVWVVDEADRVRTSAESIVQDGVSLWRLKYLLESLQAISPEVASEEAIADVAALFEYLKEQRNGDSELLSKLPQDTLELISRAHDSLSPIADAVTTWMDRNGIHMTDLDARDLALELIEAIESVNRFVEAIQAAMSEEPHFKTTLVSWSDKKSYPSLICGSTNPGHVMNRYYKPLFENVGDSARSPQAMIYTSATLRSLEMSKTQHRAENQDLWEIQRELGIFSTTPGVMKAPQCFSPANYGTLEAITLPDRTVPSPYKDVEQDDLDDVQPNPEWLRYAQKMIQRAASTKLGADKTGRTLVLCASFADSMRFGKLLARSLSNRLVVHRKGQPLSACVKEFLEKDDAILITPSAWEGLNLPNAIRHIVVPRLPFESPKAVSSIIETAFLKSRYKSNYERIKEVRRRNRVLSKLKQGFGRGIRRHDDSILFWVADPRVSYPDGLSRHNPDIRIIETKAKRRGTSIRLQNMLPERFQHLLNSAYVLKEDGTLIGMD